MSEKEDREKLEALSVKKANFPKMREIGTHEIRIFMQEDELATQWLQLTRIEQEQAVRARVEKIFYEIFPHNKKLAIYMIMKIILLENKIVTTKAGMMLYNEGIYIQDAEEVVANRIQKLGFNQLITNSVISEIQGHISRETYQLIDEFKEPEDLICLENGILNLKTYNVIPHDSEFIFLGKMPVKYAPEKDCPTFKKFLNEVLTPEDQLLVQELFGYCLYKSMPIHKAIMLTGGGSNGKSTLLNVLKAFLGHKNYSCISLRKMEFDKFSIAEIYGKLANIDADLESTGLESTGMFKRLTGGDSVTGEKKNRDPFTFVSYAKQIFSANKIPAVKDDTDAFFRRWIIIEFKNQFIGTKADKNLTQKLTTPEELSGILNWALIGLKRLLEQADFSRVEALESVREKHTRLSNPIAAFIMDNIEYDHDSFVEKQEFYQEFVKYCKANQMGFPATLDVFNKKLLPELPASVTTQQRTINGSRARVWSGLRVKSVTLSALPAQETQHSRQCSNIFEKNNALKETVVYPVQGGFEEMSRNPVVEQVTPLKVMKESKVLYACEICGAFPSDGFVQGKPSCVGCASSAQRALE